MNTLNPITYQLIDKRTGEKLAECNTYRELLNTIPLSLRKKLPNKEKSGLLPKLDDERYYIRIAWARLKN